MTEDTHHSFLPDNIDEIIHWTLPGMAMFYRDCSLPAQAIAQYEPGLILRSPCFVDMSYFAGKPVKNCRFVVASSKAAPLFELDPAVAKWGLHTINCNSIFKVLDVYQATPQFTQIVLWHIPYRAIEVFSSSSLIMADLDVDAYIIKNARESLHQKMNLEVMAELEERAWVKRTNFAIGLNDDYTAHALKATTIPDKSRSLFNAVKKITGDLTDLNEPF
ncbi:hypothetical protein [Microscilla marina]|uniref:Uncharacterized protein n=1 Tax=Microscilla marina ATCC 23134 TaxID=313606 RepID=A2A027_MICM2|nr:hypothetical protein [Microscilla marina]EAY24022.1 hypothetical protein M23134_06244 [Microscilla marina ATCC 23134]